MPFATAVAVLVVSSVPIGMDAPVVGAQGPIDYPDASGVHFFPKMAGTGAIAPDAPAFGGAAVTVNSPAAGAQNETSIAINPTNPANLIAGANDYRGTDTACGSYFSNDNGATWTDNTPLAYEATFSASGDPGMAFDSAGHGFYLCMNFVRDANDATQYVYKSTDGGNTWGPGILAAGSPHANFDDKGHIAVDARPGSLFNGNVYVAFARLNTGDVRFNRSVDGGNIFTGCPGACGDIAVNDVSGGSGANLAVGAAGSVYLGWNRNYNSGGNDRAQIRIDKSTDGGVNFNALGGDVVITDFIRDSTGSGRPAVRPLARVNFFPSFGTDPTNDNIVYAVWMHDVTGNDDSDIYFARSTDGGANWSAPKRINDDVNPVGDFHSQFFPWLAVDPVDGEVDIVWYDDRNDPDRTDGRPWVDLYFASSSDGGLSFSNNLRVTSQSSDLTTDFGGGFFGDYNAIASFGGVAHPFWTDSSSGEQQVLTTAVGGADLSITKVDTPDPVVAGQSLRYDITVTNAGPAAAFNVQVTDPLPAGVTFQASAPACTLSAGTLTCGLGNLAVGATASLTIQVLVNADAVAGSGSGSISNTATVASDQQDPNTSNNSATAMTIVNESADVRVTKLCKPDSSPAPAGSSGECTILVTNDGPSVAREVSLDDTHISEGAFTLGPTATTLGTCTIATEKVTCDLGTLQPGTTATVVVEVTSDDAVDVNDVATATSATPDPNPDNNEDEAGLTFAASANLEICKWDAPGPPAGCTDLGGADWAGPDPVMAGNNLTYQIDVTNNGPSEALNVVVEDVLPAEVTVVSIAVGHGGCTAGTPGDPNDPLRCNLDIMPYGRTVVIRVEVKVKPDTPPGTLLHNDASVSSDTFDPDNSDNRASSTTTVNASADLTLTKVDSPDPVLAGDNLTYTLTVSNGGPSTAQDVVVADTLPGGTILVSAVGGTGTTACAEVQPGIVSCEVGDLDPGESETTFITVQVLPSVPDGTELINNAHASSPTDPDGADASSTTTVQTAADLWVEKTGTAPAGNPAGALIYRITVHNRAGSAPDDTPTSGVGGPSDAQNVVVTDPLPLDSKKMIVQFLTPGCTYDKPAHTVTCTTATLAAGTSVTFEIQVQIRGSQGTITNVATVASGTFDPVLTNNSDTVNNVIQGGTGKGKKP